MIRRGVVSLNHHAAPDYRIAPERHAGFPPKPAWRPSSMVYYRRCAKGAIELLRAPRVDAVRRMGDRVIVKSFGVEAAGQL
jgi:hypothetical protein